MDQHTSRAFELSELFNRRWVEKGSKDFESLDREMLEPTDDLKLFLTRMEGKTSMLDVGCGWARYVRRFVDAGLTYTGIDFAERVLTEARRRHPQLSFAQMSFRKLEFPDASFDGIWCCCAIEYEPKANVQTVLREMRRVLTTSGILALIVPDVGESYEDIVDCRERGHLYHAFWDPDEFAAELALAGFTTLETVLRPQNISMTFIVTPCSAHS